MADEYIRLDTTIIAIDNLINEAATGTMARTLLKAKDTIYNQQRYVMDVQPVRQGRWIDVYTWTMFHEFKSSGRGEHFWCSECEQGQKQKSNYCPNCGARLSGDAEPCHEYSEMKDRRTEDE